MSAGLLDYPAQCSVPDVRCEVLLCCFHETTCCAQNNPEVDLFLRVVCVRQVMMLSLAQYGENDDVRCR